MGMLIIVFKSKHCELQTQPQFSKIKALVSRPKDQTEAKLSCVISLSNIYSCSIRGTVIPVLSGRPFPSASAGGQPQLPGPGELVYPVTPLVLSAAPPPCPLTAETGSIQGMKPVGQHVSLGHTWTNLLHRMVTDTRCWRQNKSRQNRK